MAIEFDVDTVVNEENAAYYRFLRRGEFRLQQCKKCQFIRNPVSAICPECLNDDDSNWMIMSGKGSVQTFIWYFEDVLDPRYIKTWAYREVPYNVAIVKLDEGNQLITNIDDVDFDSLKAGMRVQASPYPISKEYAILRFKPIATTNATARQL
jgi:uncharacterized OB-fold protein